jgi:para-nitrobenzyl esterase
MAGWTTDEWNFFLVPSGAIEQITTDALVGAIAGLPVEATLVTYRAGHPGATAGELLSAIQGNWLFRIPVLRLAEAHAKSTAGTYMYEFAWRSPEFNGRLGACHGADIAFVFDALSEEAAPLAGPARRSSWPTRCTPPGVACATNGDPG